MIWEPFICLLAICLFSWGNFLFKSCAQFLILCLFCCLVERVLYTGYKFFLGIQFTNSSSYSVDCYFLYGIICTTEVFNFEVQVIYLFSFVASSFNFIFKKPLTSPKSQRFTLMFSFKICMALALTFNSMNDFALMFVYSGRKWSSFILLLVSI